MIRYTVTLTPGDKVCVSLYGDSAALFPREIKINHYLIKWQLLTCRGANMEQLCPSSARNWKTSCRCRNRNASKLVSVAVLPHHVEKTFHVISPSATVWFFVDVCETCFKGIFWYYVFIELAVSIVSMWSQSLYPSQDFPKWSSFRNSAIYLGIKDHDLLLATYNISLRTRIQL